MSGAEKRKRVVVTVEQMLKVLERIDKDESAKLDALNIRCR